MLELLRIAKVNVIYIENILTFIIEISLINSFNFVLYKSIPLPVKIHDDICVIIKPTSDRIDSNR